MIVILGIDPGSVSAAWGTVNDGGGLACGDVPVVDRMVDGNGLADLVTGLDVDLAVIERVSAFPKQGVASSFRFGLGTGIIHGVLAALAVKRVEVAPSLWKRHFRLGPDKEQARALAIKLFPHLSTRMARKKDAGRAEALLIATWWLETHI